MKQFYVLSDVAKAAELYKNPVVCLVDEWVFEDDDIYVEWRERITLLHDIVLVCEEEDALVLSLKYGALVRKVGDAIMRFGLTRVVSQSWGEVNPPK